MTVCKPGEKVRSPAFISCPDHKIDRRKIMVGTKVLLYKFRVDAAGSVFAAIDLSKYLFCRTYNLVSTSIGECNIEEV